MNHKNFIPPTDEPQPKPGISRGTQNALAIAFLVLLLALILIFAVGVMRVDAQGRRPGPRPPHRQPSAAKTYNRPQPWHCGTDRYSPCSASGTRVAGGLDAVDVEWVEGREE